MRQQITRAQRRAGVQTFESESHLIPHTQQNGGDAVAPTGISASSMEMRINSMNGESRNERQNNFVGGVNSGVQGTLGETVTIGADPGRVQANGTVVVGAAADGAGDRAAAQVRAGVEPPVQVVSPGVINDMADYHQRSMQQMNTALTRSRRDNVRLYRSMQAGASVQGTAAPEVPAATNQATAWGGVVGRLARWVPAMPWTGTARPEPVERAAAQAEPRSRAETLTAQPAAAPGGSESPRLTRPRAHSTENPIRTAQPLPAFPNMVVGSQISSGGSDMDASANSEYRDVRRASGPGEIANAAPETMPMGKFYTETELQQFLEREMRDIERKMRLTFWDEYRQMRKYRQSSGLEPAFDQEFIQQREAAAARIAEGEAPSLLMANDAELQNCPAQQEANEAEDDQISDIFPDPPVVHASTGLRAPQVGPNEAAGEQTPQTAQAPQMGQAPQAAPRNTRAERPKVVTIIEEPEFDHHRGPGAPLDESMMEAPRNRASSMPAGPAPMIGESVPTRQRSASIVPGVNDPSTVLLGEVLPNLIQSFTTAIQESRSQADLVNARQMADARALQELASGTQEQMTRAIDRLTSSRSVPSASTGKTTVYEAKRKDILLKDKPKAPKASENLTSYFLFDYEDHIRHRELTNEENRFVAKLIFRNDSEYREPVEGIIDAHAGDLTLKEERLALYRKIVKLVQPDLYSEVPSKLSNESLTAYFLKIRGMAQFRREQSLNEANKDWVEYLAQNTAKLGTSLGEVYRQRVRLFKRGQAALNDEEQYGWAAVHDFLKEVEIRMDNIKSTAHVHWAADQRPYVIPPEALKDYPDFKCPPALAAQPRQGAAAVNAALGASGAAQAQPRKSKDHIQCWSCGEFGHYKDKCPRSQGDRRQPDKALAMVQEAMSKLMAPYGGQNGSWRPNQSGGYNGSAQTQRQRQEGQGAQGFQPQGGQRPAQPNQAPNSTAPGKEATQTGTPQPRYVTYDPTSALRQDGLFNQLFKVVGERVVETAHPEGKGRYVKLHLEFESGRRVDAICDTGCTGDGIIDESLPKTLGLEHQLHDCITHVRLADKNTTVTTSKVLVTKVRAGNMVKELHFVVMAGLDVDILLGEDGLDRYELLFGFRKAVNQMNQQLAAAGRQ